MVQGTTRRTPLLPHAQVKCFTVYCCGQPAVMGNELPALWGSTFGRCWCSLQPGSPRPTGSSQSRHADGYSQQKMLYTSARFLTYRGCKHSRHSYRILAQYICVYASTSPAKLPVGHATFYSTCNTREKRSRSKGSQRRRQAVRTSVTIR